MTDKNQIIAIDGVSGAGKTTVAHILAHKMGYRFLPSGMLYRFMALMHTQNLPYDVSLEKCKTLSFIFDQQSYSVISEGDDITALLLSDKCSEIASQIIAPDPHIRQDLIPIQQHFAKDSGLVCEGRDMTTVVFPDAKLSIYLTASLRIRASRRQAQLEEDATDQETLLMQRDKFDQERAVAPLSIHPCSHIIDTSMANCDEVSERILKIFQSTP